MVREQANNNTRPFTGNVLDIFFIKVNGEHTIPPVAQTPRENYSRWYAYANETHRLPDYLGVMVNRYMTEEEYNMCYNHFVEAVRLFLNNAKTPEDKKRRANYVERNAIRIYPYPYKNIRNKCRKRNTYCDECNECGAIKTGRTDVIKMLEKSKHTTEVMQELF